MLGAAVLNSVIPLILGHLVDSMLAGHVKTLGQAAGALGLLGLIYLFREALNVGRKVVVERTSTSIERDTTVALVSKLHRADLAKLSSEKVGALHGRMQRSLEGLTRFLKLTFLDLLPMAATAAFALVVAVSRQALIGGVMVAAVPAGAWIISRQLRSQRGVRLSLLRTKETMDGTIVEQLQGIDYVRVANTHDREIARIGRIADDLRAKEFRHHVAMAFYDCGKALNEGVFHIAVISAAILLASRHVISVGDVLTFSMLFVSVINPLREIHRIVDEGHEASLRVEDLLHMLREPEDASFSTQGSEPRLRSIDPVIVVQGLAMEYPGDGTPLRVLKDVSFAIPQGGVIGLAGGSGCGKTTALRILLRLVRESRGTVEVGGVSLHDVSREAIGRLVSYVGQSAFVFSGTIAENIAYGCDGISEAAIVEAARNAQIHDEIMEMPGGYNRVLTERGQNLSGGQRQRVALARVFLKKSPFVILDEATSALDNVNEQAIMSALRRALPSSTIMIVAHRLTTLEATDSILVFEEGRIAEYGTYGDLVARAGVFADLARGVNSPSSTGSAA